MTFPDSFPLFHGFKYWLNSQFECPDIGDRTFTIDDVNHSAGNPQVHPTGAWNFCTDPSAVPDGRPGAAIAAFAVLVAQIALGGWVSTNYAVLACNDARMGEVYHAHDPRLDRRVAVKVLPAQMASDPEARERLRREAIFSDRSSNRRPAPKSTAER